MENNSRQISFDKYNRPASCPKCGFTLEYKGVGEYRCVRCATLAYDDFGIVRNYIEDHKGATVAEVSDATGVSQREINEMLREERFEITADSRTFLKCKGCGKDIRSGMYCPVCAKLAEAADRRKKQEAEKKRRQQDLSGVGISKDAPESGAKRFTRDR